MNKQQELAVIGNEIHFESNGDKLIIAKCSDNRFYQVKNGEILDSHIWCEKCECFHGVHRENGKTIILPSFTA
ncbi:MAG: hypothetical protein WC089_04085 [Candidatus Paceibacterota bacterium]